MIENMKIIIDDIFVMRGSFFKDKYAFFFTETIELFGFWVQEQDELRFLHQNSIYNIWL